MRNSEEPGIDGKFFTDDAIYQERIVEVGDESPISVNHLHAVDGKVINDTCLNNLKELLNIMDETPERLEAKLENVEAFDLKVNKFNRDQFRPAQEEMELSLGSDIIQDHGGRSRGAPEEEEPTAVEFTEKPQAISTGLNEDATISST